MSVMVFFYGTLKKGHYNHEIFKDRGIKKFLGYDQVTGYSLVQDKDTPFPHAIKSPPNTVLGEVYEIEENLLKTLAAMERGAGYEQIEITTENGLKVQMFVATEATEKQLPTGLPRFALFPLPKKEGKAA